MKYMHWGALAALALAGAASAQTPSGRSGMSSGDTYSNMNAYRELRQFGICLVRTQRSAALAIIAAAQGSPEENRAMQGTVYGELDTNCMGGGDTNVMSSVLARGAVAEGLVLSGGVPPTLLRPAPAPNEVRDLPGAGRCYAAGHQEQIRGLLATRIASPEERAAATALWSELRPCLARFNLRLNPTWIRYILAEGLLTLAPTATPAPAAPAPGN
jgi:outer membrane lipoprotein SlyB